jgi:hypothetical protein
MNRSRMTTTTTPLLICVVLVLSACVGSTDYGAPAYAYGYPAYDSFVGWGGWHHGWDHGHWDGQGNLGHEAHGAWGHGLSGHVGFGGHGGGGHR